MSAKLNHLALLLCYLVAWGLPLAHEAHLALERDGHCECVEYPGRSTADREHGVLHEGCRHRHHDCEHCDICQQGQLFRCLGGEYLALAQVPVRISSVCRHLAAWRPCLHSLLHVIEPRAP